jgi:nitrate reductase beta subunit
VDRQQAHQLLDQLSAAQFDAVVRLLEVMLPGDDEKPTAEDRRAVAASREYFRQNPQGGVPFEQVVAECGLTMDQVRHHKGE